MANDYVPSRGDIVWLEFNPQIGTEQAGRRPAIVVSPKTYNQKVGLAIFCPITSQIKGYSFEVKIPENCEIQGVILSDQIKSLDWKKRKAEYICQISKEILSELIGKIRTLIDFD